MEHPRRRRVRDAQDRQEQLARGVGVVQHGVTVLMQLAHLMDEEFVSAADKIACMRGNLIVCGIGKAGLIGRKIAATFSSVGTRAHFLHPAEAFHGDLGCVGPNDVALILSNSGASAEIVDLLPYLSRRAACMIAITSKINSPLAIAADITLLTPNCTEACRLNLAPTSSTLAMLALGDALAMVVSEQKGFCEEDFAELHPGGAIGKRLANVDEVMRALHECRLCHENATIRQMLVGTSLPGRRTGAVMVVNDQQQLVGIFTDSDLTRFLGEHQANDLDTPLHQVMTKAFSAIRSGAKLSDAITILSTRKISELPVVDESDHPLGLVDITDIIGLEGPTVNPESYPLSVFDGNSEGESLGGPHSKGTATDNRSYASPSSLRIFGSGL